MVCGDFRYSESVMLRLPPPISEAHTGNMVSWHDTGDVALRLPGLMMHRAGAAEVGHPAWLSYNLVCCNKQIHPVSKLLSTPPSILHPNTPNHLNHCCVFADWMSCPSRQATSVPPHSSYHNHHNDFTHLYTPSLIAASPIKFAV